MVYSLTGRSTSIKRIMRVSWIGMPAMLVRPQVRGRARCQLHRTGSEPLKNVMSRYELFGCGISARVHVSLQKLSVLDALGDHGGSISTRIVSEIGDFRFQSERRIGDLRFQISDWRDPGFQIEGKKLT